MAQTPTRPTAASSVGVVFLITFLLPAHAVAQQSSADFFRGKTINITVGFSAGGGYDLHARVLARHFGRHVPGEPAVVVKNQPGAGGLGMVNSFYSNAVKDGTELATFDRGIPLDPLGLGWELGGQHEGLHALLVHRTLTWGSSTAPRPSL